MEKGKALTQTTTCTLNSPSLQSYSKAKTLSQQFDQFFSWSIQKRTQPKNPSKDNLEINIIGWFEEKGILQGEPESIKAKEVMKARRNIALKRGASMNRVIMKSLNKRIGESLAVSV